MGVEARPHRVLERECLDGTDPLQPFLQGLENARIAGELLVGDRLDAVDQLAQDQHGWRHDDDAEHRHDRILDGHDGGKADEREEVASERGDEQVQHLGRCRSPGGEPRDEFRAVAVGKETDIVLQQPRKQATLVVGNDLVADARHRHRLPVGGHSLDREQRGGHQGEEDDAREILVDIGCVDHVADEIGAERGARRGNEHHPECQRIAPPLPGRLLDEQSADQSGSAVGICKQPLQIRTEHSGCDSLMRMHGGEGFNPAPTACGNERSRQDYTHLLPTCLGFFKRNPCSGWSG